MRARRVAWLVGAAVLVVALLAGTGLLGSPPPTAAQREHAIESGIRCPSCEDLSVADSSAPTAQAVRAEVARLVGEGRTDQQIRQYLSARYGSSIVLSPPTSGGMGLVWFLPVAGGAVALGALAVVLVRRRRAFVAEAPPVGDDPLLATDDPFALAERRAFLVRSLADADAEHRAGDLSDADLAVIVARDSARLAAVEEKLAAGVAARAVATSGAEGAAPAGGAPAGSGAAGSAPAGRGANRRPRRQRVLLSGAIAALVAGTAGVVFLAVGPRHAGQTVTGNIPLTGQQQVAAWLAQAAADVNGDQLGPAAVLYTKVLDRDPSNEVALAQLGYLEYRTGVDGNDASLIAQGTSMLHKAVSLVPDDFAARLYLGTVLFQHDGDAAGAVVQYRAFLADSPPASVLSQAAPVIRQAFAAAGQPVPAGVPAA